MLKHLLTTSLIAVILISIPPRLQAQTPDTLSFQGRITDDGGNPLNGTVSLTFKLYKGGIEIWTETQPSVTVVDGIFDVNLGSTTTLSDIAFDERVELGISVGGDPEISPRTPLTTAPYAFSLRNLRVKPETGTSGPTLVGGWSGNSVDAVGATVSGGGDPVFLASPEPNTVSQAGVYATIGGGRGNNASNDDATIGGGEGNTAGGSESTVGGGRNNEASGDASTIAGGNSNDATGLRSAVGGGFVNTASGDDSFVGGGNSNTAFGTDAVVGGGTDNLASAGSSTVSGGEANTATGTSSTVSGGYLNSAVGAFSSVVGGSENRAVGNYSFAAGFGARANHLGSFVWNDLSVTGDSLVSTSANQFLIRAGGGVGIGTNAPATDLHVVGTDPASATSGFDGQFRIGGTAESGDEGTGAGLVFEGHDGDIPRVWGFIRGLKDNANVGSVVGRLSFGTRIGGTAVERLRIDGSGNTVPGADNTYDLGSTERRWDNIYATNTVIQTSDRRQKTDIERLTYGLETVEALKPVSFRWRNQSNDETKLGLIAQDVAETVPEVVVQPENQDGLLGLRYSELIPVLINAMQEQQEIIRRQGSRIDRLESELTALESEPGLGTH
jgi:hypothetical protein